jgi:hypothetical protein
MTAMSSLLSTFMKKIRKQQGSADTMNVECAKPITIYIIDGSGNFKRIWY